MTGNRISAIDQFAMSVLKIAQNRRLMNRFNRKNLLERIKEIPSYKTAILLPNLCDDLDAEFARWKDSKNLYVIVSMVGHLHAEAMKAGVDANASQPEEDEDEDEGEDEDEDEGESSPAAGLMAGIKKYEELLEDRVNMNMFREWVHSIKFFGRASVSIQNGTIYLKFKIYTLKNSIKDKKDRIDNITFELMERAIDRIPNGYHKSVVIIMVWLVLKIVGYLLLAFLAFTRPTIILEKMGMDGDSLPISTE